MEAILKYSLVLFPFLLFLWFVYGEIRKRFGNTEAEAYDQALKGMARQQGWISFAEAIELLDRGGYRYPQGFHAAQLLGDLPRSELSERAIRALIGCLDSSEPKMRSLAAASLARIGDASAIPALRRAAGSSPTPHEISRHDAASFDKKFHEARARREGYSTNEISVSDPTELHSDVRQAATWAIQEISQRHRL